jgi:hypothetical protein
MMGGGEVIAGRSRWLLGVWSSRWNLVEQFGVPAVRGSRAAPRPSLVLPVGSGRGHPASLDALGQQAWPLRDSDVLASSSSIVRTATTTGVVKGEGLAVDASVLEANASRYRGKPPTISTGAPSSASGAPSSSTSH